MNNSDDLELLGPDDFDSDLEYDAYVLTIFIKAINPDVQEGHAFDVLAECMSGISEDPTMWSPETAQEIAQDILHGPSSNGGMH